MIYKDHQDLENLYEEVVLKEGIEVPNTDVGQDPREGYPEKLDEFEPDTEETNPFVLVNDLLGDKVDYNTITKIFGIMHELASKSFRDGQQKGKETWKN